jgi:hypothetical protein
MMRFNNLPLIIAATICGALVLRNGIELRRFQMIAIAITVAIVGVTLLIDWWNSRRKNTGNP